MAKVTMPQLGESVAEGTIGKWLKQPGDQVAKYEPLLEVITDKVNAEVPSPVEGVLKEILVEEGATVPNNAEIAIIETADEAAGGGDAGTAEATVAPTAEGGPAAPGEADTQAEKAAASEPQKQAEAPSPEAAAPTGAAASAPAATAQPQAAPPAEPAHGPAGSDERPERAAAMAAPAAPTATETDGPGSPDARMTPAVRRLLREHGLTAAQIVGTGGGGRITREDVTNYVESQRTGQPVGGQAVAAPAGAAAPAAPAPAAAPAEAPAAAAPSAPTPAAPPPDAAPAPAGARPSAPTGATVEFPAGADEVLVPTTQMRKGIAAQMTRALQAPHAYVQMEIDAT
ncbi:MAG TPA: biotin/lipoyl-containing protein, partial [Candidatus Limnocylindrales bacterium]|nr:biotin/lipoyl-containing protein [Candidatus Limnocylindrales bacterium]